MGAISQIVPEAKRFEQTRLQSQHRSTQKDGMGTPHPDDSTIPLIRLPVDIPLPISRQSSQETLRGSETTADKAPAIAPPDVYRTSIYLQEKCFLHRYIRNKDTSAIVERPERLRAVALGLAVALARLDDEATTTERVDQGSNQASTSINDGDLLARAMSQLDISKSSPTPASNHCRVVHSDASFDVVSHPAARFIHAMSEGSTVEDYPTRLRTWAQQSESKIANGESEIPEGLSQGDLYRMSTCLSGAYSSYALRLTDIFSLSRKFGGHQWRTWNCLSSSG